MNRIPNRKKSYRFPIWLLALAISGCLGTSPPVRFYTLTSMAGSNSFDTGPSLPKNLIIGIGPVEIPELYNRPQIVTKTGENRVAFSEYHRWAGSLQEEIAAVLSENLSQLLHSQNIVPFPWDGTPEPDIKIAVNVHRFDGVLGKEAVLGVIWSMRGPQNRKIPIVKKIVLKEPVTENSYPSYVSAKSRLLADFSRELASEIVSLSLK